MFYNDEIISYLQHNHIIAAKLEQAVEGVGEGVANQIEAIFEHLGFLEGPLASESEMVNIITRMIR